MSVHIILQAASDRNCRYKTLEPKAPGPETMSGDYIWGFTKGIMTVMEIFRYVNEDLKCHHRGMTYRVCRELLDCILENRAVIREQRKGFIRYNRGGKFEWFSGKGR